MLPLQLIRQLAVQYPAVHHDDVSWVEVEHLCATSTSTDKGPAVADSLEAEYSTQHGSMSTARNGGDATLRRQTSSKANDRLATLSAAPLGADH